MDWNEELEKRTGISFAATDPAGIERESFFVIRSELGKEFVDRYPEELLPILLRVIHTTADFSYAKTLFFHDGRSGRAALAEEGGSQAKAVLSTAFQAIRDGAPIVTDTSMAASGINKQTAERFGIRVCCLIGDEEVRERAKREGITRSAAAVDVAARRYPDCIYAVGNAPTALLRLYERMEEGSFRPRLVIGVPVGFVNVVEAKELLLKAPVPSVVAKGRKGGSGVAAAICNALLYQASGSFT